MSRESILELCDMLRDDLSPTTRKSAALTVEEQVLLSLKVLASGSFQSSAKDNINVSQPTVSDVHARFMESLIRKKKSFISMPNSRVATRMKEKFYLLGRFPGVIGAIDGTHVPIALAKYLLHTKIIKFQFHLHKWHFCHSSTKSKYQAFRPPPIYVVQNISPSCIMYLNKCIFHQLKIPSWENF